MRLPYGPFNYYDLTQVRPGLSRFCANNNSPSKKLGIQSCISYRITDDIHVIFRNHIINNWVNEQFAVLLCWNIYTHMHGLIFETSIWLLAGSTRFLHYITFVINQHALCSDTIVNEHIRYVQPYNTQMRIFIMQTIIRQSTLTWCMYTCC